MATRSSELLRGQVSGWVERSAPGSDEGLPERVRSPGDVLKVLAMPVLHTVRAEPVGRPPFGSLERMDGFSANSQSEESNSEDEDDNPAVARAGPAYRSAESAAAPNVANACSSSGHAGMTEQMPQAGQAPSARSTDAFSINEDYHTEQLSKQLQAEAQAAFHAARSGDANALAAMLVAGERVNLAEGTTENTLLIMAARRGHARVVGLLLEFRDVDVDRKNAEGNTALLVAALHNEALVMAYLLNAGADINFANATTGNTALIAAACNGHAEAVKLLLYCRDIEIETVNASGDSALSVAVLNGHEDVVRSLIEAGAKVDVARSYGLHGGSLLAIAASRRNNAIIEMLIDCSMPG